MEVQIMKSHSLQGTPSGMCLRALSNSSFACHSSFHHENGMEVTIKLFLYRISLNINCHLYDISKDDSKENRRKNLLLYTSAGLAPSIMIFNSTFSKVFYFKMTLGEGLETWSIDIPREMITFNTDVAPVEQWFVQFTMHHGLDMFTTDGTLLDHIREPVLQWEDYFGDEIDIINLVPFVRNTKGTKSPCASDVAILGLILDGKINGVFLGITELGFMHRDTKWHNMTANICATLNDDCADLSLVNVILTNTRLIILSSLGLFISQDLCDPATEQIKFTRSDFCGFEMLPTTASFSQLHSFTQVTASCTSFLPSFVLHDAVKLMASLGKDSLVTTPNFNASAPKPRTKKDDYLKAKIWYNIQCLANKEDYEVDYISLSFNKDKTLSQESTCFYSNDPFTKWYSCLPQRAKGEKLVSRRVVSFLVDAQQNTGIAVLSQQKDVLVWVNKLTDHRLHAQHKFPAYRFPERDFVPFGMFFHPNSHFLYVYGNQVWISSDGGNTFILLIKLDNETVTETDACVYSQAIVFVTDKGSIYYTKAGLLRYARLTTVNQDFFSMYFDHLGILYQLSMNATSPDRMAVPVMDVNTLLQADDLGFDGVLSPQYITEKQMVFYSHEPLNPGVAATKSRFYNLHVDKALVYGPGGSGLISKVFTHGNPTGFLSSALVDILEQYPTESSTISPCILNTLTILERAPGINSYTLQLSTSGPNVFKASDREKTVVIPGASSFLIVAIQDDLNALGDATMPIIVPVNKVFESGTWFLYDFGTQNKRHWSILVDRCRYTIQQPDELTLNAIRYLDLGSKLHFKFRVTPVNIAYPVFHMPLMMIVVGRPSLLDVSTENHWDNTDSYIMEIMVHSKFFEQGKTSLAVIVTQASLVCDVTTIILTLKNSCSYLKTMHYVLHVPIAASDWLSGEDQTKHNVSAVSHLLKNLPVNYRPPSTLGISVPLTENFYNADPSKPRMRDYFRRSKTSGRYKQCANKRNRSECGCTDNMKLSFSVAFSDCKEKVLRMKFPVSKLPLSFTVKDERGSTNLSTPYYITVIEVNNRTNWEISGSDVTSSVIKMREYLAHKLNTTLYNPDGLTISIHGSELFHFRVSTVPAVSFCNLFDEFQIYVDDAPLAFPGQTLLTGISMIAIGAIIFVGFVIQMYEIQLGNVLQRKLLRRNKVSSKSTLSSASSEESSKKSQQ
ncbi:cation channel sperm-associated auxiliary subunit beta-like isoform X2 [Hemicordylus capensis]|uniref:cation channel sperm-associated auxiliary subunit beta-like isoform X2 n=1 Tax=Hemicordylus capensis TaxID=884348 RepID=UPI00230363FC|nr:cation channel sperm-associated auxiliary subunit beta-like isoform X2 [Hemicordylus capensis]